MQHRPIVAAPVPTAIPTAVPTPGIARDAVLAVALAALLTLFWAIGDWAQLRRLVLPDTDDMMRLAQVRDWIAGQRFDDWTQYRIAPPIGGPMHWSRIDDLGIAALIRLATPGLGRHAAEILAVVSYPGLLFSVSLFLSARIARLLWSRDAAWVAVVLAALAYPSNALFLPGRIDHHALQIVCIQAAVLALVGPATWRRGAAAGLTIAVSLGIGLEAVPQLAALAGTLFLAWSVDGSRERARLLGFGAALGGATVLLLAVARPSLWSSVYCDTFTPASTTATLIGAGLCCTLALATRWLSSPLVRLGAATIAGVVTLGVTAMAFPSCVTGPYGHMDPFLRHAIIDNITEAIGLFGQPTAAAGIAMGGVLAAACVAGAWAIRLHPGAWRHRSPVFAVLIVSLLVALAQARGAYVGSALAAPMLAGLVLAARESGRAAALVAAWLFSAGMTYLTVPPKLAALVRADAPAHASARGECRKGDIWEQVDRYPAGVVIAAIDLDAYIVGGTRHAVVGAGYHRNNIGNRALYAFFLNPPRTARTIARAWRVRYVAFCPGDFGEVGVPARYPASLAAWLATNRVPDWLHALPLRDTDLKLYRID